jgi:hypothetical protein
VIFLDETVFTYRTFKNKSWSRPEDNLKIDDSKVKVKTQAMISCISEEDGLEYYELYPRAVNANQFKTFIEKIYE